MADRTTGSQPDRDALAGGAVCRAGASSRITCALVPLMPNAETAATRRPAVAGQSVTLTLDSEIDISRGDVIAEGDAPFRSITLMT